AAVEDCPLGVAGATERAVAKMELKQLGPESARAAPKPKTPRPATAQQPPDDIYPDTPWKNARGIGNILRHKYDQVTEDLIWASIRGDIPRLRKSALQEIERLKKSEGDAGA